MKRWCRLCGKQFEPVFPQFNSQYCSEECRRERKRLLAHESNKRQYAKRCKKLHPKVLVCRKCGQTFTGHGCALYCWDCLNDGTAYMNKLLANRTMSF